MFMRVNAGLILDKKIIFAIGIFLLAFSFSYRSMGDQSEVSLTKEMGASSKFDNVDLERMTRLLTVVQRFKDIMLTDPEEALTLYAEQEVKRKFNSINDHIWLETTPRIGWTFFMSVAVHTVGNAKSRQPLVAFYNPISDVFLITAWRMDKKPPRMVDAEILMGDWMRTGSPTLSLIPSWLRTDMYKPAALGSSVAETIAAFEQIFPAESDAYWRKKLLVLENRQLLVDVNYPAAAIMLYNSLANIEKFRTAGKIDNPRLASCRNLTIETVRSAIRGHIDQLLVSADETLHETRVVLKTLRPEWFGTLEAVAVLTGNDGCLVFLSQVYDASGSLSFFFNGKGDELVLKRIDVVDYAGFYNNRNHASNAGLEKVLQ